MQVQGEDFTKTVAPTAKMVIVRYLLTVVVSQGWQLHQMDVHNAFLHGDLHKEIYMKPPPDFCPPKPYLVYKLKKSLYGLRQVPLASALSAYSFHQSPLDHFLFVYHKHGLFLALSILWMT